MTTVSGLPAHVLLVHVVVVLVPVAAVLLVLVVLWPRAHRRLAPVAAAAAVVALVAVPLMTDAGEWLERRVPRTPLVHTHTELGDTMLPWAIALAVVALLVAVWELLVARVPGRRSADEGVSARRRGFRATSSVTAAAVALIAVVVAAGSVVTVYRIGESGSRAVWTGNVSQQELPRNAPPDGSQGAVPAVR